MAEPGAYRCVECGGGAEELYRDYQRGVLRIALCVSTGGGGRSAAPSRLRASVFPWRLHGEVINELLVL